MAFQTRDEAQDKVSRKLDRVLNKKKKHVPLSQESWDDLYSMPIFLRNFYVKKFNKMVEDENTRYEELVAKQKTKQPIRNPGR